jgi:hypothetical protein
MITTHTIGCILLIFGEHFPDRAAGFLNHSSNLRD